MLSRQNLFLLAAEVEAASVEVDAAALIGRDEDRASARARLRRAEEATTAAEGDDCTEPRPGQPILWVNTFGVGADSDEPIGLLKGRIAGEVMPRGMVSGPVERQYLALIEAPWGGETTMVVRETDVIVVPDGMHISETRTGHELDVAIADLIQTTSWEASRGFGHPGNDTSLPPQAGPSADHGLDP